MTAGKRATTIPGGAGAAAAEAAAVIVGGMTVVAMAIAVAIAGAMTAAAMLHVTAVVIGDTTKVVMTVAAATIGGMTAMDRRRYYNTKRPHGSLGYKPPAPEVFIPSFATRAAQPQSAPPPALPQCPTMH